MNWYIDEYKEEVSRASDSSDFSTSLLLLQKGVFSSVRLQAALWNRMNWYIIKYKEEVSQ